LKDVEPTPMDSVRVLEGLLEDFARIKTACPAFQNIKIGDLVTATLRYVYFYFILF
jgi:hypothetical protein